jgi:hypothetical protein
LNKQETSEDDILTKPLADLPVSDEQAEETKGGPFAYDPTFRGGVFVGS